MSWSRNRVRDLAPVKPRDHREMVAGILTIARAGEDFSHLGSDWAAGQDPVDTRTWLWPLEIVKGAELFVAPLRGGEPGVGEELFGGEDFVSFIDPGRCIEVANEQDGQPCF